MNEFEPWSSVNCDTTTARFNSYYAKRFVKLLKWRDSNLVSLLFGWLLYQQCDKDGIDHFQYLVVYKKGKNRNSINNLPKRFKGLQNKPSNITKTFEFLPILDYPGLFYAF